MAWVLLWLRIILGDLSNGDAGQRLSLLLEPIISMSSCVVDDVIIALTTYYPINCSPSRETQKAIYLRLGDPFYSWHVLSWKNDKILTYGFDKKHNKSKHSDIKGNHSCSPASSNCYQQFFRSSDLPEHTQAMQTLLRSLWDWFSYVTFGQLWKLGNLER